MSTPFIRNHQFNLIKRQAEFLLKTLQTVADRKVLDTVRYRTGHNVLEAFPALAEDQKTMLEPITAIETVQDLHHYLEGLKPCMESFPPITLRQIQKLFPKSKKLKLPDLQAVDWRFVTYLSWVDIAANRLFIIYPFEGKFLGMEGRITPINKKGYCLFCNRHQELAYFSVKTRSSQGSPDQFTTYGQYVCMDNHICNQSITDTGAFEKFLLSVSK